MAELGGEVVIIPNGDDALDLITRGVHTLHESRVTAILGLTRGMTTGRAGAVVVLEDGHGHAYYGRTSLRLFLEAADQLRAELGDPRVDAPIEVRRDDKGGP